MNKYYVHLETLCVVHGVELHIDTTLRREHCYALPDLRAVVTPPVEDDTQYVAVLHEFGHICHTAARPESLREEVLTPRHAMDRLEEEDHAWAWARQHAQNWSPAMQMVHDWARETYRKNVERMLKNSMGLRKAALSVKEWK